MHELFITFDPNEVLCHSKHIMNNLLNVPLCSTHEMNYNGKFNALVNMSLTNKPIIAWGASSLRSLTWHTWSSRALCSRTTQSLAVGFLSWELAKPFLILGQESCDVIHGCGSKFVTKVVGNGGQLFLRVLTSNLWESIPVLKGVPHGLLAHPKKHPHCRWQQAHEEHFETPGQRYESLGKSIEMTSS